MDRIERITEMESRFDKVSAILENLESALESFNAAQEEIQILSDYYESSLWREDFEADEAGLLPDTLKRGILSEDALYNLLTLNNELLDSMK